jgi:glutamate synthase (NADPH/NADH) small chain
MILRTSTSHEEGGEREWSVLTKKFVGEGERVKQLSCVRVEFPMVRGMGRQVMREVPGSTFTIEADLVILALGFVHPDKRGLIDGLGLKLDQKGQVTTGDDFMTSLEGVFAAGDIRRGQSLIVWAIAEGRQAAHHIDNYLMGSTRLPLL